MNARQERIDTNCWRVDGLRELSTLPGAGRVDELFIRPVARTTNWMVSARLVSGGANPIIAQAFTKLAAQAFCRLNYPQTRKTTRKEPA